MAPFRHQVEIKNQASLFGGELGAQADMPAFIAAQFDDIAVLNLRTADGNWTNPVTFPNAAEVPVDSVITAHHSASWNTNYIINGVAVFNPQHHIYKSNGSTWLQVDDSGIKIDKRPTHFGVPVATLLGYYDPLDTLTSYVYPALYGSRGYAYADEKVYINTAIDCQLSVELESGSVKQYWLPNKRLSANTMNKFHVNIARSDKPRLVSVSCFGNQLVTNVIQPPAADQELEATVEGKPLDDNIS